MENKPKMSVEQAKGILSQANKKGFRKPNKKLIHEADKVLRQDFTDRGNNFMERYRALCEETGLEIKAKIEPVEGMPENIAKAGLTLAEYVKPTEPETKKWSIAAAENLALRKGCEHVEHAEGNICEKCGLAIQNWHPSGTGVAEEYEAQMLEKIKGWQEEELKEEAEKEEENGDSGVAAKGGDK